MLRSRTLLRRIWIGSAGLSLAVLAFELGRPEFDREASPERLRAEVSGRASLSPELSAARGELAVSLSELLATSDPSALIEAGGGDLQVPAYGPEVWEALSENHDPLLTLVCGRRSACEAFVRNEYLNPRGGIPSHGLVAALEFFLAVVTEHLEECDRVYRQVANVEFGELMQQGVARSVLYSDWFDSLDEDQQARFRAIREQTLDQYRALGLSEEEAEAKVAQYMWVQPGSLFPVVPAVHRFGSGVIHYATLNELDRGRQDAVLRAWSIYECSQRIVDLLRFEDLLTEQEAQVVVARVIHDLDRSFGGLEWR